LKLTVTLPLERLLLAEVASWGHVLAGRNSLLVGRVRIGSLTRDSARPAFLAADVTSRLV